MVGRGTARGGGQRQPPAPPQAHAPSASKVLAGGLCWQPALKRLPAPLAPPARPRASLRSLSPRPLPSPTPPPSAPPGTTTNGTTGSTSLGACLAFIQAGYYNSPPPAVNPAQCMADTYQPFVRSISDPTIGSCTAW
jgi:hypothetical protein